MSILTSIVQIAVAAPQSGQQAPPTPLNVMWQHVSTLGVVEALTFISFGIVCLFYGWRIFKLLVTICFGLLGMTVGIWANEKLIGGNVVWLAIICIIFFAVLSVPLMRWGVSILGSISGGILTAGATLALGLHDQRLLLAGGLVGLVAGGMISFIVFKVAVILFTSLGGSALVTVGFLAVLHQNVDPLKLETIVATQRWFLPVMLLVPMAVGIFLQHRFIKTAQDWSV
ncbi:MAG: hypothetical protein MUC88_15285 [Planctomycetes bacterium]|jgi:hypothetical protein|nr:hypothetical protein [Planctomycetota bacterium]